MAGRQQVGKALASLKTLADDYALAAKGAPEPEGQGCFTHGHSPLKTLNCFGDAALNLLQFLIRVRSARQGLGPT